METIAPRKRIEYIDAMRGFTMLLVVCLHVECIGFGPSYEQSPITGIFLQFRMPLFFFISGFLAYSTKKIWDGRTTLTAVKKKLLIQAVPTLVFGLLYTYLVASQDLYTFLANDIKLGYWFTISLLEMFLIYYGINYIVHKTVSQSRKEIYIIGILAFIAITLYLVHLPYLHFPESVKSFMDLFCAYNTFHYFQFFVFGNIAARYLPLLNKKLDSGFFTGCLIILFFSAFIINDTLSHDFSGGGIFAAEIRKIHFVFL